MITAMIVILTVAILTILCGFVFYGIAAEKDDEKWDKYANKLIVSGSGVVIIITLISIVGIIVQVNS